MGRITKQEDILLTDEEIRALPTEKGRIYYNLEFERTLIKAQIKKIAEWLVELPTDGWDKWHFYHKDLAKTLLKEIE